MTTYTAEQIEAIGGNRWTKAGTLRVYLDVDVWGPLIGLEITRYKTGNVSSASIGGDKISNGRAAALAKLKVYWENGQLVLPGDNLDADIAAAVAAAVNPAPAPAAQEPAKADPEPEVTPSSTVPMIFMLSLGRLNEKRAQRGPRWFISAQVRREYCAGYADTAAQAEQQRAWLVSEGYRNVSAEPPIGSVDLAQLGRDRLTAKTKLDEATAILRAGVLRALEDNREEAEVARTAGVDRQTVRAWAGKQPTNRR